MKRNSPSHPIQSMSDWNIGRLGPLLAGIFPGPSRESHQPRQQLSAASWASWLGVTDTQCSGTVEVGNSTQPVIVNNSDRLSRLESPETVGLAITSVPVLSEVYSRLLQPARRFASSSNCLGADLRRHREQAGGCMSVCPQAGFPAD